MAATDVKLPATHLRSAAEKVTIVARAPAPHAPVEEGVPHPAADADDGVSEDEEGAPAEGELASLRHGDLLYTKDAYRSTTTYVVVENGTRKRAQCIADDSAYGEIPADISVHLEDPVAFYAEALELYEGVGTIGMDVVSHQRVLYAAAGGRIVTTPLGIEWHDGSYMIEAPPCPDVPADENRVCLNAETPDSYLAGVASSTADPRMEKLRAAHRLVHEVHAHAYFLSLAPGARVGVRSSPTMGGGGWHGTEALVRVETLPGDPHRVTAVVTKKPHRPASGAEGEVVYRPATVIDKGPYGGVHMWAAGKTRGQVIEVPDPGEE